MRPRIARSDLREARHQIARSPTPDRILPRQSQVPLQESNVSKYPPTWPKASDAHNVLSKFRSPGLKLLLRSHDDGNVAAPLSRHQPESELLFQRLREGADHRTESHTERRVGSRDSRERQQA